VRVLRDEFGRPHIFAKTNRGLFTAYGHAVAEDRLWQLELNRRASRGRLAAIFGPNFVATDTLLRTVGYTDAELDAQLAALSDDDRHAFEWYADGINRYLAGIAADPIGRLPFEFFALGGGGAPLVPAPWSARDAAGVAAFIISRFSDSGGHELDNARILQKLIARHGPRAGFAIFDDVRWLDDAASPVTIRDEDGKGHGKRQRRDGPSHLPSAIPETQHHEAHERLKELPVPGKLGSYGWVVGPSKSAEGHAMLYGGPQMDYSAPEIVHEVQLTSEQGFNVTGMAIAGIPFVVIGRNEHLAWTLTTGLTADNVDIYAETLCGPASYLFNGTCTPFEIRPERIAIGPTAFKDILVLRSVHGPVVGLQGGTAATIKRAQWMTELDSVARLGAMGRRRAGGVQRPLRGHRRQHRLLVRRAQSAARSGIRPQAPLAGHRDRRMDRRVPSGAVLGQPGERLARQLEQQGDGRLPRGRRRPLRQDLSHERPRGALPRAPHLDRRHARHSQGHCASQGQNRTRSALPQALPARGPASRAAGASAGRPCPSRGAEMGRQHVLRRGG
jgi:penicillin amidase